MRNKDIEPNVVSFNAGICACGAGEQWQRGLWLLRQMWVRTLKPDLVSYNAGIGACQRCGQWQRSLRLLSEMCEVNLELDVISYIAAIGACSDSGQWQQAVGLLKHMSDNKLEPDQLATAPRSARARKAGSGSRLCSCSGRSGRCRWSPTSSLHRRSARVREGWALGAGRVAAQ
ncbi:unnamed protein product [Prorocentrum cordatum]|uniref:Pentatricopeptide repeat-containing protein n=1 Tax=Prorocentrum cordatum TaxID=2364126 RepID=A0ABN9SP06_9DINO|nr:unnamed protein product [Polarella glacialis]